MKENNILNKIIEDFMDPVSTNVCDLKRFGAVFKPAKEEWVRYTDGKIYESVLLNIPNFDEDIPVLVSYKLFKGKKLAGVKINTESKSKESALTLAEYQKKAIAEYIKSIWYTPEISFRFYAPRIRKVLWCFVLICILMIASSLLAMAPAAVEYFSKGQIFSDYSNILSIVKYSSGSIIGLLFIILLLHYS